ncbi:MAG: hypothetical protein ACUVTL_09405 [Thermoproteota archaeon]
MHVYICNASYGKMRDTMADGVVDFEWLVNVLRERGYERTLTIEYFDHYFANILLFRKILIKLGVKAKPI